MSRRACELIVHNNKLVTKPPVGPTQGRAKMHIGDPSIPRIAARHRVGCNPLLVMKIMKVSLMLLAHSATQDAVTRCILHCDKCSIHGRGSRAAVSSPS